MEYITLCFYIGRLGRWLKLLLYLQVSLSSVMMNFGVITNKSEMKGCMKISRKFSSLVLVGALLASLPITSFAKSPEKKAVDYVALGDSLAAGMTPTGGIDLGYADYLVNRFEQSQYTVGFNNFGVPGYTSEHLKQVVLFNEEVKTKIKESEFITIDIGSNDLLKAKKDINL